jgi:DNA-binding LytR/AlgR family response regulator
MPCSIVLSVPLLLANLRRKQPNPFCMKSLPTCIIIDDDLISTRELIQVLETQHHARPIGVATTVSGAIDLLQAMAADWLFIRITAWDEYRNRTAFIRQRPARVIFLSGRGEKCTQDLSNEVDFHLQPPYRKSSVGKVVRRLTDPTTTLRSLDVLLLRVACRFRAIPIERLQSVRSRRGFLEIETDYGIYVVAGSLTEFQQRLPPSFTRVKRGLLVNAVFFNVVQ